MHSQLINANCTTIEMYEKERMHPWPYNKGWRRNWEEVLGRRWVSRTVPAVCPALDSLYPLHRHRAVYGSSGTGILLCVHLLHVCRAHPQVAEHMHSFARLGFSHDHRSVGIDSMCYHLRAGSRCSCTAVGCLLIPSCLHPPPVALPQLAAVAHTSAHPRGAAAAAGIVPQPAAAQQLPAARREWRLSSTRGTAGAVALCIMPPAGCGVSRSPHSVAAVASSASRLVKQAPHLHCTESCQCDVALE
jgi:hypothetical protein